MQRLLEGDGTSNHPYILQGHRNEDTKSLSDVIKISNREGYTKLLLAHSGLYYEKRSDGWYLTSDTETCDKFHGIPSQGRKV